MECMTTWPGTLRGTRTPAVCLTTFLRRSGSFSIRRHFVSCLYFSFVHIWHRVCLEKQNKLAPNTNFAFLVTPPQARTYEENISSATSPFLHFFFSSRHQQRFSIRLCAIHLKGHKAACPIISRPACRLAACLLFIVVCLHRAVGSTDLLFGEDLDLSHSRHTVLFKAAGVMGLQRGEVKIPVWKICWGLSFPVAHVTVEKLPGGGVNPTLGSG